jgi:uncharacterized Zn-binding protein involved in type VI secretion
MGQPGAKQGDQIIATDTHIIMISSPGGPFHKPPSNQATIQLGSGTVFINGKPAARNADTALTCNDPADLPAGTVMAVGTVVIGG